MNNGNPFGAAIAFFIFMQMVWSLALIGGGIYVLWCLNRIASSVERLANARENSQNPMPNESLASSFTAQPFVTAPPPSVPPLPISPLPVPSSSPQAQGSAPETGLPPIAREVPRA